MQEVGEGKLETGLLGAPEPVFGLTAELYSVGHCQTIPTANCYASCLRVNSGSGSAPRSFPLRWTWDGSLAVGVAMGSPMGRRPVAPQYITDDKGASMDTAALARSSHRR